MTRRRGVWIAVACGGAMACTFLAAGTLRPTGEPRFSPGMAVLATIRTLHTAQVQYQAEYGCFAKSLKELGPPANGAAPSAAADLIGADLAAGDQNGYKFAMTGDGVGYQIQAVPISFGVTGSRTFYSDQTMVIRENNGPEPATVNSDEVGSR